MEKKVAQYGVTVMTQKHLHRRRPLAGTLAGAMEVVEQETLEAGGTSLGDVGKGTKLKRLRGAGMPPALLPRMHRVVPGAEL